MKKKVRGLLAGLVSLCATGYNRGTGCAVKRGREVLGVRRGLEWGVYMFGRPAAISALGVYVILRNVAAVHPDLQVIVGIIFYPRWPLRDETTSVSGHYLHALSP